MIDVDAVRDHLGIDPADTGDSEWLTQAVNATNAWVGNLPVVLDRPAPGDPWPEDVNTGAIMLAAHIYHSRSSAYGRATLDVTGGFQTAYADPEIARMLRLRRWGRPMIAGPA